MRTALPEGDAASGSAERPIALIHPVILSRGREPSCRRIPRRSRCPQGRIFTRCNTNVCASFKPLQSAVEWIERFAQGDGWKGTA